MTTTVCLIACSKTKAWNEGLLPARERYQGELFHKALRYAQTLTTDMHIFILSAKYCLLPLDEPIADYNLSLKNMNSWQRNTWGQSVSSALDVLAQQEWTAPIEFVMLAGEAYYKPIANTLHRIGIVSRPLEGLGIGQQLGWLKERVG